MQSRTPCESLRSFLLTVVRLSVNAIPGTSMCKTVGCWRCAREKAFSILVLGTTKCRCLIYRWYYFNQDHEFFFHSYGVNTCPVCLEGLVGRDPVKMPCSHVICLPCISEWTSQERSCPMCKQQIPEDFRIQSTRIIRLDFFS